MLPSILEILVRRDFPSLVGVGGPTGAHYSIFRLLVGPPARCPPVPLPLALFLPAPLLPLPARSPVWLTAPSSAVSCFGFAAFGGLAPLSLSLWRLRLCASLVLGPPPSVSGNPTNGGANGPA